MLVAITGATGFLGRYLVRRCAAGGSRVRCWYRPESDRSGFDDFGKAIDWMPGDLNDARAAEDLVRGADAVVHSALQWPKSGGFRSSGQDDLIAFLEANFMGSLRLMQAARRAEVPRFVFISTCAV